MTTSTMSGTDMHLAVSSIDGEAKKLVARCGGQAMTIGGDVFFVYLPNANIAAVDGRISLIRLPGVSDTLLKYEAGETINGCLLSATAIPDNLPIALSIIYEHCQSGNDMAARMHILGSDDQALSIAIIHESEVHAMKWLMQGNGISAEMFVRTGETLTILVRNDDQVKASGIYQVDLQQDNAILVPCTASKLEMQFIVK